MKCRLSNKENNPCLKDIVRKREFLAGKLLEKFVTRLREYRIQFFQALLLEDFLISYFFLCSPSPYFWAFWISATYDNCFSLYLMQYLFLLLTIYKKEWLTLFPSIFLTSLHSPHRPHSRIRNVSPVFVFVFFFYIERHMTMSWIYIAINLNYHPLWNGIFSL